jgi:hypothetical protein
MRPIFPGSGPARPAHLHSAQVETAAFTVCRRRRSGQAPPVSFPTAAPHRAGPARVGRPPLDGSCGVQDRASHPRAPLGGATPIVEKHFPTARRQPPIPTRMAGVGRTTRRAKSNRAPRRQHPRHPLRRRRHPRRLPSPPPPAAPPRAPVSGAIPIVGKHFPTARQQPPIPTEMAGAGRTAHRAKSGRALGRQHPRRPLRRRRHPHRLPSPPTPAVPS